MCSQVAISRPLNPEMAMISTRVSSWIRHPAFIMATVIILGLSLRIPILSVSPLLDTITNDLKLSASQAGWLSTIPVLCFGTVALISQKLTRRWGMDAILLAMFCLLLFGLLVRTVPSVELLFGGTVLVGAGIAVSNVILPGFIKREAPNHVGPMTAVYSAAISASGAIGAGVTIPIMNALDLDWRGALRWPAVIVIAGIVILIPWQVSARSGRKLKAPERTIHTNLWRNKLAWFVTAYMGMQSFLFFSTTGWLPVYLISEGMSEQRAGFMLSLSPLLGVVGSFIAPLLVYKRSDQRWLIWLSSALCVVGLAGMIWMPMTATVAWVVLFGFGSGMTLSLALTFIGLRTPDAFHASDLSMMAQAVGYMIAALGPIGVGFAHDVSGSWPFAFGLILASTVVLTIVGLGAARVRLVTDA